MKKLLCVCLQANVRSVTLASLLRKEKFETLACGVNGNSVDTLKMLCAWADHILVATKEIGEKLPEGFADKVVDMEIGPDIWGSPMHPDLVTLCKRKMFAIYYILKAR